MSALEAEFGKQSRARTVKAKDGRAILVHVADKHDRRAHELAEESMRELCELARTAGVDVVDTVTQLREHVDPRLVLGKGKLEDVILRAVETDCDVLIFDRELTPSQASAIAKESDLKIIDRTQLILDIFAQRAEGADGKLQVELAQLKYSLPRLAQKDDALSRLTGGIGGRGPGETKLEIGRRRAKERVTHLEDQLKKLGKQREQRRRRRTRAEIPTVAIVGYTNAGKSTLLNTLTGASVLSEDKLFATLDTRSRHLKVGWAGYGEREVIITDTVGFIRRLPKDLFAAFRATFEETADADLILHIIDAGDPAKDDHIETTEHLLTQLDLDHIPRIAVYNKMDQVEPLQARILERSHPDAVFLSALDRETTRVLVSRVGEALAERWDRAAKGPITTPEESTRDLAALGLLLDQDEPRETGLPEESTSTLDDLLRMAGKRVKKRPA
jgi:GTP-binding protein HflX